MKKARGQRSGIFLLATSTATGIFATNRPNYGTNSRSRFLPAPTSASIRCWIGLRSTSGNTSNSKIFPLSISTSTRATGPATAVWAARLVRRPSSRRPARSTTSSKSCVTPPWPNAPAAHRTKDEAWSCCGKMDICRDDMSGAKSSEHLNIVIVGHVDHGKSTLLARLSADTGALPDGKLEKVQAICRQQGKDFEYAFLFDAFLEEQEQGITIDTARTFFIWKGRQYIIIDAPGHKEFLKNMISGAARAEAALLLIDALEGVKEQSKKHGYLLSLLGVRQFAVVVNKMDLVAYRQDVFDGIEKAYREFLGQFGATPERIIPVSAKLGDNIANRSQAMPWYNGPTVLDTLSMFTKETVRTEQPLRFPIQDVYKFDARRILAGRITAGRLNIGDQLVFSPSNKRANIRTI